MSNPTTLVSQFDELASGWTVSGPERYDDGLWLEEGTTNELANSSFESNATGWNANNTGNAISRVTTRASDGTASLRIVGDGSVSQQGASNSGSSPSAASGEKWALSADIYAVGGETVRFVASERNSGGGQVLDTQGPTLTLDAGWHRRHFAATLAGGGTVAQVRFKFFTPTAQVIDLNLDACQLENKPYATSYTAGTRAASSASISPAGIFDTYLGAIVFVATPTIETGAEEIWGELGEKLAGADHIRWGRDSTKHPFVEWSGNDSAYTRVTLTATVDAGDEHFYSIEWHVGDTDFRLYLDDDPSENDTIPSPQESYGAGDFVLEATAGGVIYGGLAICSERLTNDQRARLKVVMENRGNIETALDSKRGRYGFFQVRPKVE